MLSSSRFKYFCSLILLCCCAKTAVAVSAEPEPEALLAALSSSLNKHAYSGNFTIEYGSNMESFHISRTVNDGQVSETLYRLTGDAHEFLRRGNSACLTLGDKLLSGAMVRAIDGSASELQNHYKPTLLGKERVAGRPAWIMQLNPLDNFRFGLVIGVDVETQLLTRYVVYDAQKHAALERMQFVSLSIGEDQARHASPAAIEVPNEQCSETAASAAGKTIERSPWQPAWLPPGFLLSGYSAHPRYGHIETYTDGLSSFSIFARTGAKQSEATNQIQQGVSARGAVMALITAIPMDSDTLYVSVLGEIPLPTAQKVSLSLKPQLEQEPDDAG